MSDFLYSVNIFKSMKPLLEPVKNKFILRFFKTMVEAKKYKDSVVEQDIFRPSDLIASSMEASYVEENIGNVLGFIIDHFEDTSVEIVLSEIDNDFNIKNVKTIKTIASKFTKKVKNEYLN